MGSGSTGVGGGGKIVGMNIVYVLAAVLSVLLAIYLVVALVKPEWFE